MMRRDNDKNISEEKERVEIPAKSTMTKSAQKPIKVGVHVKYQDKEYVVMSLEEDDQIFIGMGDETYTVDKSDVEVIR